MKRQPSARSGKCPVCGKIPETFYSICESCVEKLKDKGILSKTRSQVLFTPPSNAREKASN
jgi:predicted amidophosphoribosyltransferase